MINTNLSSIPCWCLHTVVRISVVDLDLFADEMCQIFLALYGTITKIGFHSKFEVSNELTWSCQVCPTSLINRKSLKPQVVDSFRYYNYCYSRDGEAIFLKNKSSLLGANMDSRS